MKPKSIVFVPVIAVIAGLSAFLAVLLICLDLVAADKVDDQSERAGVGPAAVSDRDAVAQRGLGEPSEAAPPRKKETAESGARPAPEKRAPEARGGDRPGPPEEVKRHVAETREKIESLHRDGKHDAAEEAARDLREWLADRGIENAGPPGARPPGDAVERRPRGGQPERAPAESAERRGPPEGGDIAGRIRHVQEAVEHLQMAGFEQEADGLRHRIEEMKRHHHATAAGGGPAEALMHRVEELQKAVEQMREEMRRLHDQLGERRDRE